MDATPIIGEYSLEMMWNMMQDTKKGLDEHCRIHKIDIDNLYAKMDKNAAESRKDSVEIKQSIAALNQSVSLLAQKIECKPEQEPPARPPAPPSGVSSKLGWLSGAVVAILFGVTQFMNYVKK